MAGRYYRIKRLRKRVNFFTVDDYYNICCDISWANQLASNKKHVVVKHAKDRMSAVATLITQVLKLNGITVDSYGKYASTNIKTVFRFSSKNDATRATDIINRMATPDSVDETDVKSDGTVTSNYGVKVKVDVDKDANGNYKPTSGGNYTPSNVATTQVAAGTTSSSLTKWIVIGGLVMVAIIIVLVVLKKTKIIK